MRKGKQVIVYGDGTSLYGLTHHRDFACEFLGLLGNPQAIGEAFHICTDELLTWDQIYQILIQAAGAQADLAHLPSDYIAAYAPRWGAGLRHRDSLRPGRRGDRGLVRCRPGTTGCGTRRPVRCATV